MIRMLAHGAEGLARWLLHASRWRSVGAGRSRRFRGRWVPSREEPVVNPSQVLDYRGSGEPKFDALAVIGPSQRGWRATVVSE